MVTKDDVIEVCKSYQDPEVGIDIWTMGLVYEIKIENNDVHIRMTFTSPMCPYGPQMVDELTDLIKNKGVEKVDIDVTFDPPWEPSQELREMMGV